MRYTPALASLLPALALAYEDEGALALTDVQLLGWYAIALCVLVAMRKVYAHDFVHGSCFAAAALVCWRWPDVGAFALLAWSTMGILVLGLSRR